MKIPEPPSPAAGQHAVAPVPVRFEDFAQDGRLLLEAIGPALGATVWRQLLLPHPAAAAMRDQGVVPIMTYAALEGEGGPFTPQGPAEAEGQFRMAHDTGADGEVSRILLDMWAEIRASVGVIYGPAPAGEGGLRRAGRMYAQHVLTRLFAPPGERRVIRLEGLRGFPEIPTDRSPTIHASSVAGIPPGARSLEPGPRPDAAVNVFGLTHTDYNQHVNWLAYPRLFEEAALRRLADLGRSTDVLARWVEAGFRKPSFAGERVRIVLQAFEHGGRSGAWGMFVDESGAASPEAWSAQKPRCVVRMLFE